MANDYSPIGPVPSGIANGTVDATSRQLARDMRGKAYGKDVRETIARMTEWHSIRTSASEVLAAQSAASAKVSAESAKQSAQNVTQNAQNALKLFNDAIRQQSQKIDNMVVDFTDYDFNSAPEIVAARRGKPSLGAKIDDVEAQLAHKASKESVGTVANNLSQTNSLISEIITTPAEGVNEQEIIASRKGEGSLFDKINEIDKRILINTEMIFDYLYLNGNEFETKTGGWELGYGDDIPTSEKTLTKEAGHLELTLKNSAEPSSQTTVVTGKSVDLTNVESIYIDWELSGDSSQTRAYLAVSSRKMSGYNSGDRVESEAWGSFGRRVTKLEITREGANYIRAHVLAGRPLAGRSVTLKIYGVYIKEKGMDNLYNLKGIISDTAPTDPEENLLWIKPRDGGE